MPKSSIVAGSGTTDGGGPQLAVLAVKTSFAPLITSFVEPSHPAGAPPCSMMANCRFEVFNDVPLKVKV